MKRVLLKFILPILLMLAPAAQMNVNAATGSSMLLLSVTANDEGDDDKKKDKDKDKDKDKEEDVAFLSFSLDKFDASFFLRLLIDILSMIILIRFIYYPVYRRSDHMFTFYMFNITIFIIATLLSGKSAFSTGAAFGLFAVFSLLRYRTEDISARDMTYLFTVIALGLMTSVNKGSVVEVGIINAIILTAAFALDGNVLMKTEFVKTIQYENIELIKPDRHAELLEDLQNRTGLKIHKVSIGRVDFLRDTATVKIYYYESKNQDV
jgi:hypothetical protein